VTLTVAESFQIAKDIMEKDMSNSLSSIEQRPSTSAASVQQVNTYSGCGFIPVICIIYFVTVLILYQVVLYCLPFSDEFFFINYSSRSFSLSWTEFMYH